MPGPIIGKREYVGKSIRPLDALPEQIKPNGMPQRPPPNPSARKPLKPPGDSTPRVYRSKAPRKEKCGNPCIPGPEDPTKTYKIRNIWQNNIPMDVILEMTPNQARGYSSANDVFGKFLFKSTRIEPPINTETKYAFITAPSVPRTTGLKKIADDYQLTRTLPPEDAENFKFRWYAYLTNPFNNEERIILLLHPSTDQRGAEEVLEGFAQYLLECNLNLDNYLSLRDVEDSFGYRYDCRLSYNQEECIARGR